MSGVYIYSSEECELHTGLARPSAERLFHDAKKWVDEQGDKQKEAGVKLLSNQGKTLDHYRKEGE